MAKKKQKPNSPGNNGTVLPRGMGRPKGSKNKFTSLKDSFINVFKEMGGDAGLLKFAKENPRDYYKLVATLLPKDIQADIRKDIRITWGPAPQIEAQVQDIIDVTPEDSKEE